jgi:hypothetical protein
MIAWREKFRAFYLHFFITLAMSIAAATLVFLIWYPDPFQAMLGGTKFFLLVTVCDLVLGPLTSLIIYNSKKTRRALVFDYTVVGIVQLAAFIYGVYSMASSRPVYVAFTVDQFEVVMAGEIDDADLKDAKEPYRSRPKWGPVLVGTQGPTDREERNNLLFSSLSGKDRQHIPRYYVPYEANRDEVQQHALTLDELERRKPAAKPLVATAVAKLGTTRDRLRWLPIKSAKSSFWTALVDADTGRPVYYLPLEPF